MLFVGNPLEEKHTAENDWRKQVAQRMKNLKKLDGILDLLKVIIKAFFSNKSRYLGEPVIREEEAEAEQ